MTSKRSMRFLVFGKFHIADVQDVHTVTQSSDVFSENLDNFRPPPQPSPNSHKLGMYNSLVDSLLTLVAHADIRLISTYWVSKTSRKSKTKDDQSLEVLGKSGGFSAVLTVPSQSRLQSIAVQVGANKFVLDYGHPLGTVQVSC